MPNRRKLESGRSWPICRTAARGRAAAPAGPLALKRDHRSSRRPLFRCQRRPFANYACGPIAHWANAAPGKSVWFAWHPPIPCASARDYKWFLATIGLVGGSIMETVATRSLQHGRTDEDACRDPSVPVPTFVSFCSTRSYERRNQRDTSNYMILVWLWIRRSYE